MGIEPAEGVRSLAADESRLGELFGRGYLLPLWIAEPYVPLAPSVRTAIETRAAKGWYGYEARPSTLKTAFWDWMERRHRWNGAGLKTMVSPSVGTSIGVLIDQLTAAGDGVIIQPPVFTDFKPLIRAAGRSVVRNPLVLNDDGYQLDLEGLATAAADPQTRLMILCNPHNPVGKAWTEEDLTAVAHICADNGVAIIADEIHADLVLRPSSFVPFASVVASTGVVWAATHGPIKTFGLAGVCDTLLITDNSDIASGFKSVSNRLHLTRNDVFAIEAFAAAYETGDEWLDGLHDLIGSNLDLLREGLAAPIKVMPHDATYLAWLDLRDLNLGVPELARWLAASGLALSPGHWFGREGAGFARMSIAVEPSVVEEAIERLNRGVKAAL